MRKEKLVGFKVFIPLLLALTFAFSLESQAQETPTGSGDVSNPEILPDLGQFFPNLDDAETQRIAQQEIDMCATQPSGVDNQGLPAVLVGTPIFDNTNGRVIDIVPHSFWCGILDVPQPLNSQIVELPLLAAQMRFYLQFDKNGVLDEVASTGRVRDLSVDTMSLGHDRAFDVEALSQGQIVIRTFHHSITNESSSLSVIDRHTRLLKILRERGMVVFLDEPHEAVDHRSIYVNQSSGVQGGTLEIYVTRPQDPTLAFPFDHEIYEAITSGNLSVPAVERDEGSGNWFMEIDGQRIQLDGDGLATYLIFQNPHDIYSQQMEDTFPWAVGGVALAVFAFFGYVLWREHFVPQRDTAERNRRYYTEAITKLAEEIDSEPTSVEAFKEILERFSRVSQQLQDQNLKEVLSKGFSYMNFATKLKQFSWNHVANPSNMLHSFIVKFIARYEPVMPEPQDGRFTDQQIAEYQAQVHAYNKLRDQLTKPDLRGRSKSIEMENYFPPLLQFFSHYQTSLKNPELNLDTFKLSVGGGVVEGSIHELKESVVQMFPRENKDGIQRLIGRPFFVEFVTYLESKTDFTEDAFKDAFKNYDFFDVKSWTQNKERMITVSGKMAGIMWWLERREKSGVVTLKVASTY
jgi:hypothetical protein